MKNLYSRLKLGWKLFIWEAGIVFAIVVTGLLSPDVNFHNLNLQDTLILFFLSYLIWWGLVFVVLWIIDGFKNG
jgi:hypothetical protein